MSALTLAVVFAVSVPSCVMAPARAAAYQNDDPGGRNTMPEEHSADQRQAAPDRDTRLVINEVEADIALRALLNVGVYQLVRQVLSLAKADPIEELERLEAFSRAANCTALLVEAAWFQRETVGIGFPDGIEEEWLANAEMAPDRAAHLARRDLALLALAYLEIEGLRRSFYRLASVAFLSWLPLSEDALSEFGGDLQGLSSSRVADMLGKELRKVLRLLGCSESPDPAAIQAIVTDANVSSILTTEALEAARQLESEGYLKADEVKEFERLLAAIEKAERPLPERRRTALRPSRRRSRGRPKGTGKSQNAEDISSILDDGLKAGKSVWTAREVKEVAEQKGFVISSCARDLGRMASGHYPGYSARLTKKGEGRGVTFTWSPIPASMRDLE